MNRQEKLFLKYGVLLLITFQTTILVLVLRYSRKNSNQNARYFNSTAVFLSELFKFFICILVLIYNGKTKLF